MKGKTLSEKKLKWLKRKTEELQDCEREELEALRKGNIKFAFAMKKMAMDIEDKINRVYNEYKIFGEFK